MIIAAVCPPDPENDNDGLIFVERISRAKRDNELSGVRNSVIFIGLISGWNGAPKDSNICLLLIRTWLSMILPIPFSSNLILCRVVSSCRIASNHARSEVWQSTRIINKYDKCGLRVNEFLRTTNSIQSSTQSPQFTVISRRQENTLETSRTTIKYSRPQISSFHCFW